MKKVIIALLATSAIPAASAAIQQNIDVIVSVPSVDFYVKPQFGWPSTPVTINYDPGTKTFSKWQTTLLVKNKDADVTAEVAFSPVAVNETGDKSVALDVTINNKAVTTKAASIHTKAPTEAAYPLQITSKVPNPAVGTYSGSVSLVFDVLAQAP